MTSTSTAQPSPLPPAAHLAHQTLAVAIIPTSRHRPQGLASSHRTKTQASSPFSGTCLCTRSISKQIPRGAKDPSTQETPFVVLASGDSSQDVRIQICHLSLSLTLRTSTDTGRL